MAHLGAISAIRPLAAFPLERPRKHWAIFTRVQLAGQAAGLGSRPGVNPFVRPRGSICPHCCAGTVPAGAGTWSGGFCPSLRLVAAARGWLEQREKPFPC